MNISGVTKEFIKENGLKIKCVAKVFMKLLMVVTMRDNLLKTKSLEME